MTEVRNAEELANKESNRIGAVHQELSELGLAVETRIDLARTALLLGDPVQLLSADRGMRRFAFLSVRDPVHGETWSPAERPARLRAVVSTASIMAW